jgi:hypothetical protein
MVQRLGQWTTLRVVLVAALLAMIAPQAVVADDATTEVRNVRFEVAGQLVYVYYDLIGVASRVHRITITLYREGDPTFVYRPVNLVGDIGTIVFSGQDRRITWDFTKEFPNGLSGNDYYFVVEAAWDAEKGISPLVWIGGGAALVGGVLAIVLLSGGSSDTGGGGGTTSFPQPPGRP